MSAADRSTRSRGGVRAARWPGLARVSLLLRTARVQRLARWVPLLAATAAAGMLYGALSGQKRLGVGALFGFAIGGMVMLFERDALLPRLRQRLRTLPLVASVLLTEAAYLVLIVIGHGVAGAICWSLDLVDGGFSDTVVIAPVALVYSVVAAGVFITLMRMRDLIGASVFRNVLLGRYYRPVEEERIFLFIDLIGSTAYAQAHGDLKAQALLAAIFVALAGPVRDHGGTIDDYVGDMALVTWPMRDGLAEARCVRCVFAFDELVRSRAAAWRRDFGEVPRFRAALHGGSVVTAEVGLDRHKISYFGDVVNTTGRLEALSRTFDSAAVISADLYDRLPALPAAITARPLGRFALKGRGTMLGVLGPERRGGTVSAAAA